MMIDPGARDRSIVVQSRPSTDAVDASYAPVDTWSDLCTMWALKRRASGGERNRLGQTTVAAIDVFEVNYRADLDPEQLNVPKLRRILFNGRVYDVIDAEVVDRRDGIRLYALAGEQVES